MNEKGWEGTNIIKMSARPHTQWLGGILRDGSKRLTGWR